MAEKLESLDLSQWDPDPTPAFVEADPDDADSSASANIPQDWVTPLDGESEPSDQDYSDTSADTQVPGSSTTKKPWQKLKIKRADRASKPIPPKPRSGALVKPLTDLYTSIGTMMLPFDQVCGLVVVNSAEDCARSLDTLARENPKVRRALMAMVETSVWGQVIAAHLPIITAVAMHHVGPVKNALQGVPITTMPQPQQPTGASSNGSGTNAR